MSIFDLSGDDVYKEVRKQFYKCPNVSVDKIKNSNNFLGISNFIEQIVLICFSMGDKKSFDSLRKWIDELQMYNVDFDKCYAAIVGCKSDSKPKVMDT